MSEQRLGKKQANMHQPEAFSICLHNEEKTDGQLLSGIYFQGLNLPVHDLIQRG